jgi:ribosome-associated protein
MATPETRRQLLAAVAACEDKKGEDTRILELDPADSGLADFFLITSASNDRQVVAIADEIEFRLKKEFGLYATSVEGRRQAEWILLDYVDIVIHVFLAEKRAFYDIERLRKSARNLTGAQVEAELKAALTAKTLAARKKSPSKKSGTIPPAKTTVAKSISPAKKTAAKKSIAKGESTVSAVKKAAPKKAAAKKVTTKVAPAKAALKKAAGKTAPSAAKPAKELKKLPGKKKPPTLAAKPAKKAAAKSAAPKKVVAPKAAPQPKAVGVTAPKDTLLGPPQPPKPSPPFIGPGQGAKPPILRAEAPPEAIALAASTAPKATKKGSK